MIRDYAYYNGFLSSILVLLLVGPGSIFAAGWSYVRKLTICNPAAAVTDEVVVEVVLYEASFDYSRVSADGADLRFSDKPGRLTGGGLSYWIE